MTFKTALDTIVQAALKNIVEEWPEIAAKAIMTYNELNHLTTC